MGLRIVKPETVKLDLPDGEWIEIKKELNYGEQAEMSASAMRGGKLNPTTGYIEPDSETFASFASAKIVAYMIDWSLKDDNGKSVPYSAEMLKALDVASVAAIRKAVNDYTDKAEEESPKESPASSDTGGNS